jgi:peptidoglycan/xylan/chitin deacetylase (PgdA/CDA1 family)
MTGATNDTPQEVPRISLTFDDGPHPIWTPRVLGALERAQTRATFFVVAPLARRFPHLISDILRYGHGVEFHCTEHVRHTEQSRKEVQADVRDGLRELRRQGVHPRFWRPPWGWARFPSFQVEETADGAVTVHIVDLRYAERPGERFGAVSIPVGYRRHARSAGADEEHASPGLRRAAAGQ